MQEDFSRLQIINNFYISIEEQRVSPHRTIPQQVNFEFDRESLDAIAKMQVNRNSLSFDSELLTNLRYYCLLQCNNIARSGLTFTTYYCQDKQKIAVISSNISVQGKIFQQIRHDFLVNFPLIKKIIDAHYWSIDQIFKQLPLTSDPGKVSSPKEAVRSHAYIIILFRIVWDIIPQRRDKRCGGRGLQQTQSTKEADKQINKAPSPPAASHLGSSTRRVSAKECPKGLASRRAPREGMLTKRRASLTYKKTNYLLSWILPLLITFGITIVILIFLSSNFLVKAIAIFIIFILTKFSIQYLIKNYLLKLILQQLLFGLLSHNATRRKFGFTLLKYFN